VTVLPDHWPPDQVRQIAPVFPMPGLWLFPYVVLPLHVFEPRYRQMVEDSLDGPGRIVLATIQTGHESEAAGSPPLYPLAGLGEIGRHERRKDGLFDIWLVGLQRVRIHEVESDSIYRQVEYEAASEVQPSEEEDKPLRQALTVAIEARTNGPDGPMEIPPDVPISRLADLLVLRIPLPKEDVQRLHSELDVARRARLALLEHEARPVEMDEDQDEDKNPLT